MNQKLLDNSRAEKSTVYNTKIKLADRKPNGETYYITRYTSKLHTLGANLKETIENGETVFIEK